MGRTCCRHTKAGRTYAPFVSTLTLRTLAAVVVLTACHADSRPTEKAGDAKAERKAESEPAEPEAKQPPPPQSALAKARADATAHMEAHFEQGRTLQRKLVVGDLPAAKQVATQIAALSPKSYPAEWLPFIASMRGAAETTARAEDLAAAAAGAGQVAGACGRCHEALGKGPRFATTEPPADDPTGMKAHQWAATRMWEGIVGPSDPAWGSGTQRFATLPECQPDLGGELAEALPSIEDARARVGELTQRATQVTDVDARARLYGDYLGACATCHATGC